MRPDVLPWNCNKKKREVSQAEGFPGFSRAVTQNLAISGQVILFYFDSNAVCDFPFPSAPLRERKVAHAQKISLFPAP